MTPTAIETERLVLRRFKASDLDPFTRLMTTSEVTRFLAFPDEMKTEKGARELLENTIQSYGTDKPLFSLAVERTVTGTFLGCCGAHPLEKQIVEIFYAVLPAYWGQGIGTEVARGLTDYLFRNTNTRQIKAFIVPWHAASMRVAEKCGFYNSGLVKNPNFEQKVYEYVLDSKDN